MDQVHFFFLSVSWLCKPLPDLILSCAVSIRQPLVTWIYVFLAKQLHRKKVYWLPMNFKICCVANYTIIIAQGAFLSFQLEGWLWGRSASVRGSESCFTCIHYWAKDDRLKLPQGSSSQVKSWGTNGQVPKHKCISSPYLHDVYYYLIDQSKPLSQV
jgi:hypothetical protein